MDKIQEAHDLKLIIKKQNEIIKKLFSLARTLIEEGADSGHIPTGNVSNERGQYQRPLGPHSGLWFYI